MVEDKLASARRDAGEVNCAECGRGKLVLGELDSKSINESTHVANKRMSISREMSIKGAVEHHVQTAVVPIARRRSDFERN